MIIIYLHFLKKLILNHSMLQFSIINYINPFAYYHCKYYNSMNIILFIRIFINDFYFYFLFFLLIISFLINFTCNDEIDERKMQKKRIFTKLKFLIIKKIINYIYRTHKHSYCNNWK